MDIATHAMMGIIGASPFVLKSPEGAAAFVFGSVVPDLDVLSFTFGKRVFLRCHQTYTHALPIIAALGGLAWLTLRQLGFDGTWVALGLVLGMALHSLLDVTNTYGITLFAPFSRRRFALEWIFFIDAAVLVATVLTCWLVIHRFVNDRPPGWQVQASYGIFLAAYWAVRGWLRHRAGKLAPAGTVSLLPSALMPWHYLGCARQGETAILFHLNARTGTIKEYHRYVLLDEKYRAVLDRLPEFRIMRSLSPAYHLIDVTSGDRVETLRCRDLRTRNFQTRFGDLEVDVTAAGDVGKVHFHV
jgi:membrane-bound metal-dependent hydrolase YbcI (DUF457 family)